MQVYILEFTFSCGAARSEVNVNIIAVTKASLREQFNSEICSMREYDYVDGKMVEKTADVKWREVENSINEYDLEYPLVIRSHNG